jgi:hypothetical protein
MLIITGRLRALPKSRNGRDEDAYRKGGDEKTFG